MSIENTYLQLLNTFQISEYEKNNEKEKKQIHIVQV